MHRQERSTPADISGPVAILVVASSEAVGRTIVGSFQSGDRSFRVEVASRLSDGLRRLNEGRWDAMVIDPFQDGCDPDETLRLLRDEHVGVPMVLMSAPLSPRLERLGAEAGIVAYLEPGQANADEILRIIGRTSGPDPAAAQSINASMLDALPAGVALVSATGTIVAVNRAWISLADDGDGAFGPGTTLSDPAGRMFDRDAVAGITSVLRGERERFTHRLAGPNARTGRMTVTPFHMGTLRYALVMIDEVEGSRRADRDLLAVVNAMDDIIFTLDLEGRHTSVFGSWVKRSGLSDDDFLGKTVREILGADAAAPHEAAVETARAGRSSTYLWSADSPEGKRIFQTTLSPVIDPAGSTTAIVGVGRDVTEIHRLQEDMSIMSMALEQAPVSVVMTDAKANIEYVNAAFESLSGYSLSEILGMNPRILQSGLTPPATYQEMWGALQQGKTWRGFFANRRKDGTTYWESALVMPVKSDDGSIAHFVAIKQDITAQRQEEERARRSQERFERAFRSNPTPMIISSIVDGRILEINDAALTCLRRTRRDMIRQTSIEADAWIEKEVRNEMIRRFKADGRLQDFAARIRRGDGSTGEVLITSQAIELDDGPSILTHFVDLTEQRRAEQALRESEANYRLLFLSNPHPMWAYDLETLRFLAVNDAAVQSYGYTREEFLSMTIVNIRPAEDLQRLKDNVRAVTEGIDDAGIWRHRKKDGRLIDVHVTSHTMTFDGHRAEIVLAQDVTERLAAEREVRESEDRYRRLFDETTSAVFISRLDGRIEDCNPAFLRIFGFADREQAFRRNMKEMYPSTDMRHALIDRLRRERYVEGLSLDLIKADGSTVSVIANISGIFNGQGDLVGTQGYLTDDTLRRKLEQQLFQAQKMESLGTLAGGIAHDFNNILGIILAHSGLIPHYSGRPEKLQSSLDSVSKACDRGAGLVRQLMTFARLNEPAREVVRLNDQVDEILKLMQETFPKFIVLEHEHADPSPVINVDPVQFHQVLLNLCVNARDAMMPNGGTLKLTTRLWHGSEIATRLPEARGSGVAEVCVTDTGMGMDEATKARIFEPFFTTKPKGRGTGLGLSTVYGIVKAHQGWVEVESEPGEGTSFHVFLPSSVLPGSAASKNPMENNAAPGQETILLVEDEEALREATATGLEQLGYRVRKAADVSEALDVISQDPGAIDIIVTDYGLPRQNGGELISRVRSIRPELPVVVITGFLEPEQRRGLLEQRVAAIVMKPVRFADVVQAIRAGLERPTAA